MSGSGNRSIQGIDIVRFAAALSVAAYHLAFKAQIDPAGTLPPWWAVTWFGWIGVQVFFVISGFVIAYSSQHGSAPRFVRSRILRLGPGLWISAAICAAILLTTGDPPRPALVPVLVLYAKSAVFWPIGPWIAGQYWTLGVELAFYGLIALLLAAGAFRHLERLTCLIALASACYWAAILLRLWPDDRLPRLTALLLLQHGCYFALGTCFWLVARHGLTRGRVLIMGLCCLTALPQIAITCAWENTEPGLAALWWIAYLVWLGVTVVIAASIRFQASFRARIGSGAAAVRQLGLATYPLYLLHSQVGGVGLALGTALGVSAWMGVLLALGLSVVAALVVSAWLEPALRQVTARVIGAEGSGSFLKKRTKKLPTVGLSRPLR